MDKSREAELAAALGKDWEYVEDVGYCYKGNHQQERAVVDKAICNRVRELWCDNRESSMVVCYWQRDVELALRGMGAEIYTTGFKKTEAAAWEEALLWLVEKLAEKGEKS